MSRQKTGEQILLALHSKLINLEGQKLWDRTGEQGAGEVGPS